MGNRIIKNVDRVLFGPPSTEELLLKIGRTKYRLRALQRKYEVAKNMRVSAYFTERIRQLEELERKIDVSSAAMMQMEVKSAMMEWVEQVCNETRDGCINTMDFENSIDRLGFTMEEITNMPMMSEESELGDERMTELMLLDMLPIAPTKTPEEELYVQL